MGKTRDKVSAEANKQMISARGGSGGGSAGVVSFVVCSAVAVAGAADNVGIGRFLVQSVGKTSQLVMVMVLLVNTVRQMR